MSSWGSDLWDSYPSIVEYVTSGTNNLVELYAKFVKDKADLDKQYAKGLRKLLAKYEPKKVRDTEETTENSSFRAILRETGYQAGQHEIFAELTNEVIVKEIQNEAVNIFKNIKENSKKAKMEKAKIDDSYMRLDKCKLKYQNSFHDWKENESKYEKADADGKISRNEISRMKRLSEAKHSDFETCFGLYSEQLDKTNIKQREYFESTQPEILSTLQNIEQERLQFVIKMLKIYLEKEKDMVNMKGKCREGVEKAIECININKDHELVIERYKTGEFPPTDIQLEEIESSRNKKAHSLTRRMTNINFGKKKEKQSLFQKKRRILKNIEKYRTDILKGTKEKQALELMVQSYIKTPQFGDASRFQQELEVVIEKLEGYEENIANLKRELDLVESKMNLNMRHSLLSSPSTSMVSMSTNSCNGSDITGDGDDSDIFEDKDLDEDALDSLQKINNDAFSNHSSDQNELIYNEWDDENYLVIAMYDYDGAEEGTLAMDVGDEFEVLGKEVDGWISVRRKGFIEEGFVPAAFTQLL